MNTIVDKFEKMGATATIGKHIDFRRRRNQDNGATGMTINVSSGIFDIRKGSKVQVQVIDLDTKLRHLLLHVNDDGEKMKFLCGHDERDWFVAEVPGGSASNIKTAMDALKPAAVREAESKGKKKNRNKRRSPERKRQGEWFFIPRPDFQPPKDAIILPNEQLSRGAGSKPHIVDQVYRHGGTVVFVHYRHAPAGVSRKEMNKIIRNQVIDGDRNGGHGWQERRRDATAYAKGRVRHSDHATLVLDCWHEIHMNTESRTGTGQRVVFLD